MFNWNTGKKAENQKKKPKHEIVQIWMHLDDFETDVNVTVHDN